VSEESVSPDPIRQILDLAEDGDIEGAIQELDALREDYPDSGFLLALRAWMLIDLQHLADADADVRAALAQPDNEDPRFALIVAATVALALREPDRVLAYTAQILDADPSDEAAILLDARGRALLGRWDEVKARAEYILAGDPDNEEAAQLKLLASQIALGERARLSEKEWDAFAERFPHNAFGRAGRGWSFLRGGRRGDAEAEFRDALALDPGADWAREGLLLTLKARYPGYGLLLRFFFWMQSFTPGTQMLIVFGGLFGYRVLRGVARDNPSMRYLIYPVLAAYVAFVVLSWLADPLLNLLLLTTPEGRRLVTGDKRVAAQRVGAVLAAGVLLFLAGWGLDRSNMGFSGLVMGLAAFAITAAYQCEPGKYRTRMLWWAAIVVGLALVGAATETQPSAVASTVGLLLAVLATWVGRWWASKSHESA